MWVQLFLLAVVGFVSNVLALLSSGRMFDRKWNWPESLAGFRQPLPVPAHANPCQFTAQPRPPWEKERQTSSGKMKTRPSLPLLWPPQKDKKAVQCICSCVFDEMALEQFADSKIWTQPKKCLKRKQDREIKDMQNRRRMQGGWFNVLWLLINICWQMEVGMPEMEKQKR